LSSHIDFGGALRRWWWVVVLLIVLAMVTAFLVTSRQQSVYESSAMLIVGPSSETREASEILRGLDTLERRTVIATFARIPATLEVREAVALELGVESKALRPYKIHGSVVPNTNIMRIGVEGPNPETAASIANAAAEVTAAEARQLYRVYSMRVLARAIPRGTPTFPDPQRNLLVGGAVGLFLGIAAALVLDRARTASPGGLEES
jgi:capsular polysaccharide biosynthesis protein